VDFAPTVLSLAGIQAPSYLQGQAFLGSQKKSPRKYVYAGRDRMDTEYDRVRMVRDKQYMYLYNYMPEKTYYQDIEYRLSIPMMKEILQLRDAGKLDSIQMKWFSTKPVEELYDVVNDPFELHNLANEPKYKTKLQELKTAFENWTKQVGDMGNIPETEMLQKMWNNQDHAPVTDAPQVTKVGNGVKLSCTTEGVSIGYRIINAAEKPDQEKHIIESWDYGFAFGRKNGGTTDAKPVWNVYNDEVIQLYIGDVLQVNAMRIGYKPVVIGYTDGKVIIDEEVK
ncbi:MAG: hypothetical protein ABI861_07470, partial [Panacibacter sp.]